MSETFLTNCPHCKSVFKLRKEHLEVASGHVRCGSCHSLFLATDSLVSMEKEQQKSEMPADVESASDKIIENAIPELSFEADFDKEMQSSELDAQATSSSWLKRTAIAITSLILVLFAFWYFYLWPNRAQLSQDPTWRPVLEMACASIGCHVVPLQDVKQFQVSAIDVTQTSGGKQQVSLLLKNNADFAQPFPKIRVILSDIRGQQFTTPTYSPADYLPELNHNSLVQVAQSVQISFSFNSDSKEYSGYQVELVP